MPSTYLTKILFLSTEATILRGFTVNKNEKKYPREMEKTNHNCYYTTIPHSIRFIIYNHK